MKKIAIGEEQEYARRLAAYLMHNASEELMVYCFTSPELLRDYTEDADLYVLNEEFYKALERMDYELEKERLILISGEDKAGTFFRWDSPRKLIYRIDRHFARIEKKNRTSEEHKIITVYAPANGMDIREQAMTYMKTGDLYLGFEDYNDHSEGSYHMAEICYYLHLREEGILDIIDRNISMQEGRCFVDSPCWFFDFMGVTEEDYVWLFDRLKQQKEYGDIYIGMGNAAVNSLNYFQSVDKLILLEQDSCRRFCDHLAEALVKDGYMKEEQIIRGGSCSVGGDH